MLLEGQVRDLMAHLLSLPPWAELFGRHGITRSSDLSATFDVDRTYLGFADFFGDRAALIQPGDPARSLLYHCLASPAVRPPGLEARLYPTLEQIDLVENYIYGLAQITEKQRKKLVPAVFAYEYRQAHATPHGLHADLVFSRMGIARVGNAPARYDPVARCHAHEAEASHEVRAIPARYGAFLCERVRGGAMDGRRLGTAQFGDSGRAFLVPLVKLFEGQKLGKFECRDFVLESFHHTDRLRRLFAIGRLPNLEQVDLDRPPFVRHTRNGGLEVEATNLGASVTVAPTAQPLVRQAIVSAGNSAGEVKRGVTEVPPKGRGIDAWNENRRYSTLRVGQEIFSAGIDYVGAEITGSLVGARVFLSPRNSPEFINMRHRSVSSLRPVEDLNVTIPDPAQFAQTLDEGRYPIALYLDDICDGFVRGRFRDASGLHYMAAPAFSVITAPDFFPCIGNLDIASFSGHFKDGGPSPLCEGRLSANSSLRDPDTYARIFGQDDTVAAAVSWRSRGDKREAACDPVPVTTALTDGASNVFAPGWDVTYGRDDIFSSPYYHTAGLGSPFVEDAKLCAAANGMWAAASPDAARTFKAARTPTAIPLTDAELGLHPDHPEARAAGQGFRGWDGEYGPFLQIDEGRLVVNTADIMRSDYVSNALRNLLRFDRLRAIDRSEIARRMRSLGDAIALLDGAGAKVSETPRWLVVFREIPDWSRFSLDSVLPGEVIDGYRKVIAQAKTLKGSPGYLLGFCQRNLPTRHGLDPARLLVDLPERVTFVLWHGSGALPGGHS